MSFLDARSFLIAFLENSMDGVFAVDTQCQIVVWNGAIEQMFGKSKSSVMGHALFDVLSFLRETGEDWAIREGLAGRGGNSRDQKFFLPETGREGWYDARYIPLRDDKGEIAGVLGILRDQTQARLAMDEMKQESERRIQELQAKVARAAASAASGSNPERGRPSRSPAPKAPPRLPSRADSLRAGATLPSGAEAQEPGPSPSIFDPEAALHAVGDPSVLAELIQDFILSLPEFVRAMDQAVERADYRIVGEHAEDVKKAAEALGGARAARIALTLIASVERGSDEEIQRGWWRLRRELAVLREAVREYRKTA